MILFVPIVIGAPFMLVATFVFVCFYLGWTALFGISVFLVFIPLQVPTLSI